MLPQDKVTVFSSQSAVRSPRSLLKSMVADLKASRELSIFLFRRNRQASYRETFLGAFWTLIPAFALAGALTLAARADILKVGSTNIPYPLFVILNMTLWQLFVESMNAPVDGFSKAKAFLTKVRFPREALFISRIGEVFFNLAIKSVVVAAAFLIFGVGVGNLIWLAPFAILPLVAFGLMIGFLLVPMSVLFQDVVKAVTYFTSYWLFITPVAFQIPESGLLRKVMLLNPVTPLLVTAREVITGGPLTFLSPFLILTAISIVGVCIAWIILYISIPLLVERMSS